MKQDTSTGKNHSDNYCYYYLHVNHDLIHKSKHFNTSGFEESSFVVTWWLVDLNNRLDSYNMLIAAYILGAEEKRIFELAKKWGITNSDVPNYLERMGLKWEMDGSDYCVKIEDFEDLNVSQVGFGESLFEAVLQFFKVFVNKKPDETKNSENKKSE